MILDPTTHRLRLGMTSRLVVGLRERLVRAGLPDAALAPGTLRDPSVFDEALDHALRTFQQNKGLIVDGVLGRETEQALHEAQYTMGDRPLYYDAERPLRGDDVAHLQANLSRLGFYYGHLNGEFSRRTHHAVVELQANLGLEPTGVVDLTTIAALARINKSITSSKAYSLRDYRRLEQATHALRQHVVILVPGAAAGTEPMSAPEQSLSDRDRIATDVAIRTYELLDSFGASPVMVAPADTSLGRPDVRRTDSMDAAVSEQPDALVLSLHCDWNQSSAANGVATFFWGDQNGTEPYSPIGEVVAGNLLKELVARTGSQDLGCHPRQWEVLRSTGVPTVWVDLGYLSHEGDRENLEDPEHRERLAEALLCGLQRMYMRTPEPLATGTMSLDDIASYYGQ